MQKNACRKSPNNEQHSTDHRRKGESLWLNNNLKIGKIKK